VSQKKNGSEEKLVVYLPLTWFCYLLQSRRGKEGERRGGGRKEKGEVWVVGEVFVWGFVSGGGELEGEGRTG